MRLTTSTPHKDSYTLCDFRPYWGVAITIVRETWHYQWDQFSVGRCRSLATKDALWQISGRNLGWQNTIWLTSRNAIRNQRNTGAKPKQAACHGIQRTVLLSCLCVFLLYSVSCSITDGWCTTMTFCTHALKSIRRWLGFTLRAICTQPTEFISIMSCSVAFCGFIRLLKSHTVPS